mmetsp:Transcript_4933/g.17710  ORF Transcript_4933/g.17710 Transcript_4933/m.17710 type:complete len:940 (+) Transcript_4933:2346-5165(+)
MLPEPLAPPLVVDARADRTDIEGLGTQGFDEREVVQLRIVGQRDDRRPRIRLHRDHQVVRHRAHQRRAGDAPFADVLFTRIADGDLEIQADGDLRDEAGQLSRADDDQAEARPMDVDQQLPVEAQRFAGAGLAEPGRTRRQRQLPGDQFSMTHGLQQRRHAAGPRERLHHHLDGAAAGQPETPRLFGRNAVGHHLRQRPGERVRTGPMDQVFLDAAAGDRSHHHAIRAQRQHRPGRPRAGTPGLGDRDEGDLVAFIHPAHRAAQNFQVDAVHLRAPSVTHATRDGRLAGARVLPSACPRRRRRSSRWQNSAAAPARAPAAPKPTCSVPRTSSPPAPTANPSVRAQAALNAAARRGDLLRAPTTGGPLSRHAHARLHAPPCDKASTAQDADGGIHSMASAPRTRSGPQAQAPARRTDALPQVDSSQAGTTIAARCRPSMTCGQIRVSRHRLLIQGMLHIIGSITRDASHVGHCRGRCQARASPFGKEQSNSAAWQPACARSPPPAGCSQASASAATVTPAPSRAARAAASPRSPTRAHASNAPAAADANGGPGRAAPAIRQARTVPDASATTRASETAPTTRLAPPSAWRPPGDTATETNEAAASRNMRRQAVPGRQRSSSTVHAPRAKSHSASSAWPCITVAACACARPARPIQPDSSRAQASVRAPARRTPGSARSVLMQAVSTARGVKAGIEGHDDPLRFTVVGHGLVRQPGREHDQPARHRIDVHMGRLQVCVAEIRMGAAQRSEWRAIEARHAVGCAVDGMRGPAGRRVDLDHVHRGPRAVAVRMHVVEGALVGALEPHALDGHLKVQTVNRPSTPVGQLGGVAETLDQEAHESLPLRQLHAIQQIVFAGEEGRRGLPAVVQLRGTQCAENANQQRIELLGAGMAMHPERRGPERMKAGLDAHRTHPAVVTGQCSVCPVRSAKRCRSSGVSMSTR